MSSSFWLLGVETLDFSPAEKERTACKDEQIYKMTTIFTEMVLGCSKQASCKKLHIDRRHHYRKDFYKKIIRETYLYAHSGLMFNRKKKRHYVVGTLDYTLP